MSVIVDRLTSCPMPEYWLEGFNPLFVGSIYDAMAAYCQCCRWHPYRCGTYIYNHLVVCTVTKKAQAHWIKDTGQVLESFMNPVFSPTDQMGYTVNPDVHFGGKRGGASVIKDKKEWE